MIAYLPFHDDANTNINTIQIPNQKKPAFGQNKVRADIFPRFFGSFSIRKGRFGIGRRLDGGNRRPLLMKIGSDIFKCGQPITKWAVFQQRPPADFPFKLEFFIFCSAGGGTGQKRAFSDSRIKGGEL